MSKMTLTPEVISNMIAQSTLQVLSGLGLAQMETEVTKTSAKVRETSTKAQAKAKTNVVPFKSTKPKGDEDTIILPVPSEGRLFVRIPARAFVNGVCKVDGAKYEALDSDNGRSAKINPSEFDAEAGDIVVLTRIGKNSWESSVESAPKASKKAKAKAKDQDEDAPKSAKSGKIGRKFTKATKVTQVEDEDEDESIEETLGLDEEDYTPIKMDVPKSKAMKEFARRAAKNADLDYVNENIASSEWHKALNEKEIEDTRVYFTTRQSKQFRKYAKANFNKMQDAVEALDALVLD